MTAEASTAGSVTIIGLGPGDPGQLTAEAIAALQSVQVLYGYGPYLARVPERAGQQRRASDNREEIQRARGALEEAAAGAHVGVVSAGDPGVYGMAAAVCEALEAAPPSLRELPVKVAPGITAMLALSARVGAPLGHDFCAVSLSDNLKPWETIESRLRAVAAAGFVIALYNPISRHRPWQLGRTLEILAEYLPLTTPVVIGRAVGRFDESVLVTHLSEVRAECADMSTCIIVGTRESRVLRAGLRPLVYTPRSMSNPRALTT
jgi:precorrin-3B C17-methyltransferase